MGFLDRLFGREERRDVERSAPRQDSSSWRTAPPQREDDSGDNASCRGRSKVVRERIEKVMAEKHPGCRIQKDVPIKSFGLSQHSSCIKHTIDYILSDEYGREVAAVLILNSGMDQKMWLKDLYRILEQQYRLKHVHFLLQLPNRISYIEQKLDELLG